MRSWGGIGLAVKSHGLGKERANGEAFKAFLRLKLQSEGSVGESAVILEAAR